MSTLKDVAQRAGVSSITVSRVINTPELVKEKTKDKVMLAMAELKYVPNAAAKSLAVNRTGLIDVFIPSDIDLNNPFVMHFIAGISNALSKRMYPFLILRDKKKEHLCDGYIVTGLLRDEINEFNAYASERDRPVVLFGHTNLPKVSCIDVDNFAGAENITEYLIRQGHRKIVMINVDENKDYTEDRYNGYCSALEKHKLAPPPNAYLRAVNNVQGGHDAALHLMETTDCTAIFCATDTMAIGVCQAIMEKGLRVPEDISVVGFDGLGHNLLSTPHVTTVQQPVYRIGEMLAEQLLKELDGKSGHINKLVKPDLIEGKSVSTISLD